MTNYKLVKVGIGNKQYLIYEDSYDDDLRRAVFIINNAVKGHTIELKPIEMAKLLSLMEDTRVIPI